jgi:hypothetical protein
VRVSFPLNDRAFASWDTTKWVITPGCYTLAAGSSSRTLPSTTKIGRGARCGSSLTLPTTGRFQLPVSPAATTTLLAGGITAPVVTTPKPTTGNGLPATGLTTVLPTAGAALITVMALRRRRFRLTTAQRTAV